MEPKQLMKKGEREVAVYIKQECCRSGGDVQLNVLLDFLLDPSKDLDEHDRLKWCKALIAGGVTFEEFAKTGNILLYFILIYLLFYLLLIFVVIDILLVT